MEPNMDFITLSCPSCGAKLKITNDIDRFACSFCGNEHIVKRDGGVIVLKPIMDRLDKIDSSTDRTASELAINRLKEEIKELEKTYQDSINKKNKIETNLIVAIIAFFLGLFLLIGNLKVSSAVNCLVPVVLVAGGASYFFYISRKGWKIICENTLQKMSRKRDQLQKHKEIVETD
jgi:hypothetical protein